jgi:hypothetical protein
MTMSLANRVGIFFPDELDAMRVELDAGDVPGETPTDREDRAAAIIAKRKEKKSEAELPQR